MTRPTWSRFDRGQSVSVNYTLSLVIVTLLISGLFISTSGFVETERERAVRSELDVLGNRIAADVATADRLARSAEGSTVVEVRTTIPSQVAETDYAVRFETDDMGEYYDVTIELEASAVSITRTVSVRTRTALDDTDQLNGGSYVVVLDGGQLGVRNVE